MCVHTRGEVGNFYATLLKLIAMLLAKFDENLLAGLKVIVKNFLLTYYENGVFV